MFIRSIETFHSNVALIGSDSSLVSYRQLLNQASNFARKLPTRKLVFLVCATDVDSIVAYTSLIMTDAVVLLLDVGITDEQLTALASRYEPDYMFLPRARLLSAFSKELIADLRAYCLTRTVYDNKCDFADDLFLLLSTSGTTGNPKLVRLSKNNVSSNMEGIIKYLEINERERAILTMPISYSYGLSVVHTHLNAGAALVIPDSGIVEKKFWKVLREQNVTSISGVPWIYEAFDRLGFYKQDLPELTCLTQAGGALDRKIIEKMVDHCQVTGKRYFTMYGQTEASPRMSYVPWDWAGEKIGSIGKPISGGQFFLETKSGEVISEPHQVGELVYTGANVMLGYAECREDLANGDEYGGILRTGDLAYRDHDDFYYISGRKNRIAKVLGIRLDLSELESELLHIGLEGICCEIDQKLTIFVRHPDAVDRVSSHVRKITGLSRMVIDTVAVNNLPMTSSGKIAYSQLANFRAQL